MPVIGTAGHVDHGKSTLVMALTGRDPDRWAEEKRRGLTIDIGFAWTTLGGVDVSFVDVPGHERYLKNMLAGIEPIDAALLVVAADEGWMPQSEEHLAVLDLLDVRHGVVALTKTDLVDSDLSELATLEVLEHLAGTSLEDSDLVPVSAKTGSGLEELRAALANCLSDEPVSGSRPRLWVDRSFSIGGAGTVVTGTLVGGSLAQGDTVTILPGNKSARVRGLQSHESDIEIATPRRRLAVNLSGVDRDEVPRGVMLGLPGQWDLTQRFSARLRPARYVDQLTQKGAFQLHIGSGAHRAEIQRIKSGLAVITIDELLPLQTGDRFILRDTGRRLVVAGGIILDPDPGPLTLAMKNATSIDPLADPDEIATALLGLRGSDRLDHLAAHSGGGSPIDAVVVGESALSRHLVPQLQEMAAAAVQESHRSHPLRSGLPIATLATTMEHSQEVVARVIEMTDSLERVGPDVRSKQHRPELSEAQETLWSEAHSLLVDGLAVPRVDQLPLDDELVHLLIRTGQLVRISKDLVVLPDQAEMLRKTIKEMSDGFTVAEFRDATKLSRKYAVPFLEWADNEGLTVRRGDLRYAR